MTSIVTSSMGQLGTLFHHSNKENYTTPKLTGSVHAPSSIFDSGRKSKVVKTSKRRLFDGFRRKKNLVKVPDGLVPPSSSDQHEPLQVTNHLNSLDSKLSMAKTSSIVGSAIQVANSDLVVAGTSSSSTCTPKTAQSNGKPPRPRCVSDDLPVTSSSIKPDMIPDIVAPVKKLSSSARTAATSVSSSRRCPPSPMGARPAPVRWVSVPRDMTQAIEKYNEVSSPRQLARSIQEDDEDDDDGPDGCDYGISRLPVPVRLMDDADNLTPYECLIRKHLEFFEAEPFDVENFEGSIRPRQVGLRCRHCAHNPTTQAVMFPRTYKEMIMTAENLAQNHLPRCPNVSAALVREFEKAEKKKYFHFQYWEEAAEESGVVEGDGGLRWSRLEKGFERRSLPLEFYNFKIFNVSGLSLADAAFTSGSSGATSMPDAEIRAPRTRQHSLQSV